MKHLEIEPTLIHLQGISRTSSFKLINKNDFLAVSFSIVAVDQSLNVLKVFPDQGILLGGEQQKIRVKMSSQQNSTPDEIEISYNLVVGYTYNSQYNKRCFIKNNMNGWNQLQKGVFEKEVRIVSGGEREDIEKYIKQQINFQKKFGTEQMDISIINKQQDKEVENQSYIDLDISSKFDQKLDKIESKFIESPLNASIDVDRIIPLDIGQSRSKNQVFLKKVDKKACQKDQIVESRILPQKLNKSFEITMKTAQKNSFSKDGTLLNSSQTNHKQRTLDIVILAIISAFFVALGSNIKRITS